MPQLRTITAKTQINFKLQQEKDREESNHNESKGEATPDREVQSDNDA